MLDWLSSNWWAMWLIAAAILAVTELLTLDFTLLMLAAGAFAGAVAAFFLPGFLLAQVLIAVAVAGLLLAVLRPTLLRNVRNNPGYTSPMQAVVGSTGRTVTEITSTGGEIKLAGDVWTARSYGGNAIPADTPVDVVEVDGAVVIVLPRDQNPDLR